MPELVAGANQGLLVRSLTAVGDVLYFVANDSLNNFDTELWQADLDVNGNPTLQQITTFGNSAVPNYYFVGNLTSFNGGLVFDAQAGPAINGIPQDELYWVSGANDPVPTVNLIATPSLDNFQNIGFSDFTVTNNPDGSQSLFVVNNTLLNGLSSFSLLEVINADSLSAGIYQSNLVDTIGDQIGSQANPAKPLIAVGSHLVFSTSYTENGELWQQLSESDGGPSQTLGVPFDLGPAGAATGSLYNFTSIDGALYFFYNPPADGNSPQVQLWAAQPDTGHRPGGYFLAAAAIARLRAATVGLRPIRR